MTAEMVRFWRAFFRWLPVTCKCFLWFGIAVGSEFLLKADKLTSQDVGTFGWWEWLKFATACLIPGFIVIRTFFDQSVSRHAEMLAQSNTPPKLP